MEKFALPIVITLGIISWILYAGESASERDASTNVFSPGYIEQARQAGNFRNETVVRKPSGETSETPLTPEEIAREIDEINKQITMLQADLRASPYKGMVELSRANATANHSTEEYIAITFSKNFPQLVSISNWTLESARTGRRVRIGPADTVPYGRYRETDPVVVRAGDTVYVHTGRSPIRVSFRTNMCTGYLDDERRFTPRLPVDCPRLIDEIPDSILYGRGSLSDRCIEAIERIGRCEIPDDIDLVGGPKCEDVVEDYASYSKCVRNSSEKVGFAGNIWHIYLGRNTEFWRQEREIITLFDNSGKVVDVINY